MSGHVQHHAAGDHWRYFFHAQLGHAFDGDEIGSLVAVVVDVVDTDVADAVELGADAGPAVDQFIVEAELVAAQGLAGLFARLDVVQVEAAVAEGRQVFAHRYGQRVGLAGLDQADRLLDHFGGKQVGGADFILFAVGRGLPVGGQGGLGSGRQGDGEQQGLEAFHRVLLIVRRCQEQILRRASYGKKRPGGQ
ncbi:hypothetical protein D3C75_635590 [compost metagenome]